eukprot:scaffold6030_cov199-Amphora_coffeaeformis.AAC.2
MDTSRAIGRLVPTIRPGRPPPRGYGIGQQSLKGSLTNGGAGLGPGGRCGVPDCGGNGVGAVVVVGKGDQASVFTNRCTNRSHVSRKNHHDTGRKGGRLQPPGFVVVVGLGVGVVFFRFGRPHNASEPQDWPECQATDHGHEPRTDLSEMKVGPGNDSCPRTL